MGFRALVLGLRFRLFIFCGKGLGFRALCLWLKCRVWSFGLCAKGFRFTALGSGKGLRFEFKVYGCYRLTVHTQEREK